VVVKEDNQVMSPVWLFLAMGNREVQLQTSIQVVTARKRGELRSWGCKTLEVSSGGTRECSLHVVSLVLSGNIRFQEEEGAATVLHNKKQESRLEQPLGLIWVGCD
jgi:hypothetical protein